MAKNTTTNKVPATQETTAPATPTDLGGTVEINGVTIVISHDQVTTAKGTIESGKNKGKETTLYIVEPTAAQVKACPLSAAREYDLGRISNAQSQLEMRTSFVRDVLSSALRSAFFDDRRNNMQFVEAKSGKVLYVNGTGTKMSAGFTKAKAEEFLSRIDEFKAAVAALKA